MPADFAAIMGERLPNSLYYLMLNGIISHKIPQATSLVITIIIVIIFITILLILILPHAERHHLPQDPAGRRGAGLQWRAGRQGARAAGRQGCRAAGLPGGRQQAAGSGQQAAGTTPTRKPAARLLGS